MPHRPRPIPARLALAALLLLAGACVLPRPFLAAEGAEHWQATGTTAISVTGNVTFAPDKIQFQTGQSLPLAIAGHVADFKDMDDKVNAAIYRVTAPADLRLKNGNHLCGGGSHTQTVTYIAVWHPEPLPGDKPERAMAAFSGQDPPRSTDSPSSCGVYNYELQP